MSHLPLPRTVNETLDAGTARITYGNLYTQLLGAVKIFGVGFYFCLITSTELRLPYSSSSVSALAGSSIQLPSTMNL